MTYKRAYLVGTLCTFAACSGGENADGCDVVGEPFLSTFTETSGDCGPLDPSLAILGQEKPGCHGALLVGDDCTVTNTSTCVATHVDSPITSSVVTYVLRPAAGGLSGTLDVRIQLGPDDSCHSFYSANLVRQ